jgi:dTDP-4-amino-4,6-dideoxygalactose transaminase
MRPPGPDVETPAGVYELCRFRPESANLAMSARARWLLRRTPHDAVRDLRRRHYRQLSEALSGNPCGIVPLFPRLDEGTCPLFFPVVVEDPPTFQRKLKERRLAAKHVWAWFHPSVPWEQFPREAELKRKVFGLPVHQALREEEVERLAEALRSGL